MTPDQPVADDAPLIERVDALHACVHLVERKLAAHVAKFDDHCVDVTSKLEAGAATSAQVEKRLALSDAETTAWRGRSAKRAGAVNVALKKLSTKLQAALANQETVKAAIGLDGGRKPFAFWSAKEALGAIAAVGGGLFVMAKVISAVWPFAIAAGGALWRVAIK